MDFNLNKYKTETMTRRNRVKRKSLVSENRLSVRSDQKLFFFPPYKPPPSKAQRLISNFSSMLSSVFRRKVSHKEPNMPTVVKSILRSNPSCRNSVCYKDEEKKPDSPKLVVKFTPQTDRVMIKNSDIYSSKRLELDSCSNNLQMTPSTFKSPIVHRTKNTMESCSIRLNLDPCLRSEIQCYENNPSTSI